MPELPEVETVRRGLDARDGRRPRREIRLRRPDIRFPFPAAFERRLSGRRIVDLSRRAKYLLFTLDSGETLIAHLGMSGSFRIENGGVPTPGNFLRERSKDPKHDHVVMVLDNGWVVTYNDPRRFGFMDLAASGQLADHPRLQRARRRTARARVRRELPGEAVRRRTHIAQSGAARSKTHRRPGQHLCVRGPFSSPPRPDEAGGDPRGRARRTDPRRGSDRRGDPQRARGGHRGRRFDPSRSSPGQRRIGIFPARLQSL